MSGTALSERTDDGGGAESAPTAAVPSSSSRRPVVAHRSGEDTSETDMEASDDASQKRAAKSFAARTQLRRGFFCSALKRQLEALRAENAALKDCARAELDQAECAALFATLGSESAQIIGDKTAAEATTEAAPLPTTTESSSALLLRRDLSMVQVVQNAQKAFVISQPGRPDNPIMWCSDAFLTLTGYSRSAVLGRNCRFLQGPETNPKAVDDIRAAIEAEAEADVTLLNYRADGSKFWNRFFIAPLRDSTGKVIYFVGVQSDATHLVQSRQLQPSHEPRALALT